MNTELENYLHDITTLENINILRQAAQMLDRIESYGYQQDIDHVLATAENHTTETNLYDIFNVFGEYLDDVITEHGIQLVEDADVSLMTDLLEALLSIPSYGDPQPIIDALDQETNIQDRISDVLDVVSPRPSFHFNTAIDSVNEDLVARIRGEVEPNLTEETSKPDVEYIRTRFHSFRQKYPESIGQEAIESGKPLGCTADYLFGLYAEQFERLEGKPEELAKAIISLLMISDVKTDDIFEQAKELIEDLAKDINVVTKTTDRVTKILKDVSP